MERIKHAIAWAFVAFVILLSITSRIRAAAKNHERVTLICDPADYNSVLAEIRAGGISAQTRTKLAIKGFASTAHYDTAIHAYLLKQSES